MRFVHPNGCYFALAIEGYQFPELAHKDYDSNWLNISIDVKHTRGRWQAADPALLTYEIESLAQWLGTIAAGRRDKRHQWFLEPCLSFHVPDNPERDEELTIEFSHEFSPPWASGDLDELHLLAFPVRELDLLSAAASLREQLKVYPQRTEQ